MILRFVIPGKPVGVNAQHAGGNARVKTREARDFNALVAWHGAVARKRARWATYSGPVEVEVRFLFASERPDIDGPVKPLLDALQVSCPRANRLGAGILVNDRQVRRVLLDRDVDRERPRIEIAVAPLGELLDLSTILRARQRASSEAP